MSAAARLLSVLVALLLAAGLGFVAGDRQCDNAWKAKGADLVRDALRQYEAERDRGLQAAAQYLTDLKDKEDSYEALEKKFNELRQRVPLMVPAAGQPATGDGAVAPCINFLVRPQLSLGAVWMWNSALEGRDVPAGSCGADAATIEACSAASGITAEDAWDNQSVNAKSCAADRLRYDRLIDYLEGRAP